MANLFTQAKQLLDKKDAGGQLTEEEFKLVSSAMAFVAHEMPKAFPGYDKRTVSEDLEALANMVNGQAPPGQESRCNGNPLQDGKESKRNKK